MTERPFIIGITPRFWVMALVLLCALSDVTIGQEGTGRRAYEAIPGKYASTTPASTKVSASLRAVMDKMEAQGMTRRNARELGASTLSNPLVRVDEEGSIQTYIHVDTLGDVEKAVLETYDVSIELTNEALGIIQAWVPFDRIDELAQLAFVTRITPPSYATPRVGSVTTEGDTILRADALRALGFDGRGVKVESNEPQAVKGPQAIEGLRSNEQKVFRESLKPTSSEPSKISPTIRSLINEMQARGITRHNAKERQAASYSTPLLKVDNRGNIQTYIRVKALNATVIAELKAKQVDIELTNASLQIVQAWVPFDLVEEVARLAVVELIEPPSYGVLR